jgi:RHS repeat-associated protein
VYGLGTVTATQVMPDPKTRIYAFTGASFNSGPQPGPATRPGSEGDPVDPSSGAFIMEKTDLYLPDVMPLVLTRTYNSLDNSSANVRPFGIGMTHAYGIYQYTTNQFAEGDLILPDSERIHLTRISDPAGSYETTVMEAQATPTAFYKARLRFDGNAWEITRKDGTVYIIGHMAQLQRIRDRYGNETRLTWSDTNIFGAGVGNLLRITSPNGRWIAFTYDTNLPVNRITDATDNIGRNVHYTYDANGHLSTATDPEGNVTTYTWDANHRMTSIKDGRNIVYLTNHYDASGRVDKQTLADPAAFYSFAYTTNGGGNITRTEVTNPRGYTKQLNYNPDHYLTSQVEALNQPEARTTTITRLPTSNLVSAVVDGLSRRTEYTYDDFGHVQQVKQLADTAEPVITTYAYEQQYFQLASIKDPLQHEWAVGYDSVGRLASMTDPLSHQTVFNTDVQGRIRSVTSPLQHTWQYEYTGADQAARTDPLGSIWRTFTDSGGRLVSVSDPIGRTTRFATDKLDHVRTITDGHGGQTSLEYDPNGKLLSLTDARSHTTSYTYDAADRTATRTDPLQSLDYYAYDGNGNLTQTIDRQQQVTTLNYDVLDRVTMVTFNDGSTTTYTYDAGDRLRRIVDSVGGTITREYDGLDRLLSETTPHGTVTYEYDLDGRRRTMTVTGQLDVTYEYDDAHRLTSITQGSSVVGFAYDNADRRLALTLPNGVVTTYGFDNANQLTELTYTRGQTTLGTLTYTYDAAGQRTSASGTWARTNLPAAVDAATYDSANRVASWQGQQFSFDANGKLMSDGATDYTWNARNELTGVSGSVSATFGYDGAGRRSSRTEGGTGVQFLYDGLNPVEELSGGTPTANLLTGLDLDQYFTRTDAAGTSTFLSDALGSTIALTTSAGALATEYLFQPFGSTLASGTATTNALSFTGREVDGTGLQYFRARYYSPSSGRFISEDPIGLLDGPNMYSYVHNSPLTFRDPLGLSAQSSALCCLKGAAGGAAGAIVVGALAAGAAAIGAPVAAVTIGLGVAATVGAAALGADIGWNAYVGNLDGLAYDVCSIVGGASAGAAGGRRLAAAVNRRPSPPWSWASDRAQGYDSNYPGGSPSKWMATGPNPGSAAGSAAAGGAGAARSGRTRCGC